MLVKKYCYTELSVWVFKKTLPRTAYALWVGFARNTALGPNQHFQYKWLTWSITCLLLQHITPGQPELAIQPLPAA